MNEKEEPYVLLACRGKSTQYAVDNPDIHKNALKIFKANEWKYGFPDFLLNNSKMLDKRWDKATAQCVMHHPEFLVPHPVTGEEITFLECLSPYYKKRHGRKILSKEKIYAPALINWDDVFLDAWSLGDIGLRCICIGAMRYKNIKVVGFDLWEADYWTDGCFTPKGVYVPPRPRAIPASPNHKERIARGTTIKHEVLDLLFDFMRLKKESNFQFYTLSKSLYERQREEDLPNATIELIKS